MSGDRWLKFLAFIAFVLIVIGLMLHRFAAAAVTFAWTARMIGAEFGMGSKAMKHIAAALLALGIFGATGAHAQTKNFRFLKPDGLLNSPGYAQAVEIEKGKLVILAGQMPVDDKGALVGAGDFKAQATRAFENIVLALKSVGLDTSDIVKLNYFVVGDLQKNLPLLRQALPPFFKPGQPRPTGTVAGVTSLALEGQMIEIDVTAVSRN